MTWAPEQRRASLLAALGVATATLVVLLVAVWAASAGPDDPFRGEGPLPNPMTTSETTETSEPPVVGDEPPFDREETGWVTTVVAVILGVLVLVLVGCVVAVLVVARPRLPRWRRHRREQVYDVEPDPVEAIAAAITEDAGDQEDLLRSGSPRNGVVACWHHFEVQAERAGVAREPWETSSEFTLRLLDLVEADAASVGRLARSYREARFSEHELGEDARAEAQEALRQIHHDLRTLLSGGRR